MSKFVPRPDLPELGNDVTDIAFVAEEGGGKMSRDNCDIRTCRFFDLHAEEHCGAPTSEAMTNAHCPLMDEKTKPKEGAMSEFTPRSDLPELEDDVSDIIMSNLLDVLFMRDFIAEVGKPLCGQTKEEGHE